MTSFELLEILNLIFFIYYNIILFAENDLTLTYKSLIALGFFKCLDIALHKK